MLLLTLSIQRYPYNEVAYIHRYGPPYRGTALRSSSPSVHLFVRPVRVYKCRTEIRAKFEFGETINSLTREIDIPILKQKGES